MSIQEEHIHRKKPKSPLLSSPSERGPLQAPGKTVPNGLVQRMASPAGTILPGDILYLQRTIGNRAVSQMLHGSGSPMRVGASDDRFEQEANRVSEQISASGHGRSVQRSTTVAQVGPEGGEISGDLASHIRSAKGGGSPAPEGVRRAMEEKTGADLGHVRVHNNKEANSISSALGAKAATYGNEIFLGRNQSPHDVQLMAHELTHTIQQTGGGGHAQRAPLIQRLGEENMTEAERKRMERKERMKEVVKKRVKEDMEKMKKDIRKKERVKKRRKMAEREREKEKEKEKRKREDERIEMMAMRKGKLWGMREKNKKNRERMSKKKEMERKNRERRQKQFGRGMEKNKEESQVEPSFEETPMSKEVNPNQNDKPQELSYEELVREKIRQQREQGPKQEEKGKEEFLNLHARIGHRFEIPQPKQQPVSNSEEESISEKDNLIDESNKSSNGEAPPVEENMTETERQERKRMEWQKKKKEIHERARIKMREKRQQKKREQEELERR